MTHPSPRMLLGLAGIAVLVGAIATLAVTIWWPSGLSPSRPEPVSAVESSANSASTEGHELAAQPATPSVDVKRHPSSKSGLPGITQEKWITLIGTVAGPQGESVQGGELRAEDSSGKARSMPLSETKEYALAGLAPGPVALFVSGCAGYLPFRHELDLETEKAVARYDIVLQPSIRLGVRFVTPRGERLATIEDLPRSWISGGKLTAIATTQPTGSRLAASPPEPPAEYGAGRYFDGAGALSPADNTRPFDGLLELLQPPPLFGSAVVGDQVLATMPIEAGQAEIVFVIGPGQFTSLYGTVRLRALDGATGAPLKSHLGYMVVRSDHRGPVGLVAFDSEGRGELDLIPPGECQVVIEVNGYAFERQLVRVQPGLTTDLGDIALAPAGQIEGRVVDEHDNPVTTQVWCGDIRGDHLDLGRASNLGANSGGRFAIASLPCADLLLGIASDEWARNPILVSTHSGNARNVVLTARRGTRVSLDLGGTTGARLHLKVMDSAGVPVWSRETWCGGPSIALRLLMGTYELVVTRSGGDTVHRSFEVGMQDVRIIAWP